MIKDFNTFTNDSLNTSIRQNTVVPVFNNGKKTYVDEHLNDFKKSLRWIDLNLPSGNLWSNINYIFKIGNEYMRMGTFNNINREDFPDGAVIPSKDDFDELIQSCDITNVRNVVVFKSRYNNRSIKFTLEGYIDNEVNKRLFKLEDELKPGYYMTDTIGQVFVIKDGNSIILNQTNFEDYKLSIRLVKKS